MSDYYCWEQYFDSDTKKQTKSDEIRYAQGHDHGVQPTQQQWDDCLADLVVKVNNIRTQSGLATLLSATISNGAERKTRSAH